MSEHIHLNALEFFTKLLFHYTFLTFSISRSSPHAFRGCSEVPHGCCYFSEHGLDLVATIRVQDQGDCFRKATCPLLS